MALHDTSLLTEFKPNKEETNAVYVVWNLERNSAGW